MNRNSFAVTTLSEDMHALVQSCSRLATNMRLPSPPFNRLQDKLRDLLDEKKLRACVAEQIITREEGCSLVLAHLSTFIADEAGAPEPKWTADPQLGRMVEDALFGENL